MQIFKRAKSLNIIFLMKNTIYLPLPSKGHEHDHSKNMSGSHVWSQQQFYIAEEMEQLGTEEPYPF